jgi:hypothetical protein
MHRDIKLLDIKWYGIGTWQPFFRGGFYYKCAGCYCRIGRLSIEMNW